MGLKLIIFSNVQHLQGEISKLTGELNAMINAFAEEQNKSQDLGCKLASMEKELRFKIDVLGSELASERGKTNIDIASLDTRIQGQYADRYRQDGWCDFFMCDSAD